jgi:ferredoxin--NADP+ reductase
MLETFLAEKMEAGQYVVLPDIVSLLESRKVDHVSFADWKLLDAHETETGEAQGRPRLKLTSLTEMLEIIRQKR